MYKVSYSGPLKAVRIDTLLNDADPVKVKILKIEILIYYSYS